MAMIKRVILFVPRRVARWSLDVLFGEEISGDYVSRTTRR